MIKIQNLPKALTSTAAASALAFNMLFVVPSAAVADPLMSERDNTFAAIQEEEEYKRRQQESAPSGGAGGDGTLFGLFVLGVGAVIACAAGVICDGETDN